jgi:hypothetical protein
LLPDKLWISSHEIDQDEMLNVRTIVPSSALCWPAALLDSDWESSLFLLVHGFGADFAFLGGAISSNRLALIGFLSCLVWCIAIQAVGAFRQSNWDFEPKDIDYSQERLWSWADNPVSRAIQSPVAQSPLPSPRSENLGASSPRTFRW